MTRSENPPWIDKAVTQGWETLASSELATPKATLSRSKRHVKELGCGHYGCVLETDRPDVVIKITSDPTEARLVALLLAKNVQPDGLVRYHRIERLPGERRGRPMFAIWREAAYDVGRALDVAHLDTQERQNMARFRARIIALKRTAHDVKAWADRAKDPFRVLEAAFKGIQYGSPAHEYVELSDREEKVIFTRWPVKHVQTRVDMLLKACEMEAQMMGSEPEGYLVGNAIEQLIDEGILLADVHGGNIGRVDRPDHKRAIVITDPGHAVFLTRALDEEARSLVP